MIRRNINLCSLLVCGCIILLFVRNIHSYPHTEFDDPNSFESSESNEDEIEEPEIQTTRAAVSVKGNQSLISNVNHVNGNGTNLRSYTPQNISTPKIGKLFNNNNTWSKNSINNEWNQNIQSDTTQHHILHNGNESPISLNFSETLIEPRLNQMQNDVNATIPIDSRIVFPSEIIPRIPPRCNNSLFCENVPDYPEDMINNAIRQNSSLKYLEIIDELLDIQPKLSPSEPDERPLCESTSQIIYPQMAPSKHKGDLIIVNQPNFKQGIRIEKCVNENSECSITGSNIPGGYRTKCVQKYIDRKLVAVTGVNEVAQELFPIPSSCCCHAIFMKGAERFGMGVKQTSQMTPAKNPKN